MTDGQGAEPRDGGAGVDLPRRIVTRLSRASLSVKLILFGAVLTAVVVGSAFWALNLAIRASTKRFLAAELRHSLLELINLQNQTRQQLLWTSSVITDSPTLRAAMETYRLESVVGHSPRSELLGTIQREVDRILAGLGKDLLIVTDDRGKVLAASERRGARPAVGDDLSMLPVVRRALDTGGSGDSTNFDVARFRGTYLQIGCVPILLQGIPIGTLILGERLDQAYVARLRASFGGSIAIVGNGEVIATSLPEAAAEPSAFADLAAERGSWVEGQDAVRLGGEDFVVAPLTLGRGGTGDQVMLYVLRPLSQTLGPLNRTLRLYLLLCGLVAVILAGVGAAAVSRSLLGPFRGFVGFMESVAETGDYSRRFTASDATAEIRTLNASYGHLIDSLATKHAQVEQRTAELSQANLALRQEIREREQTKQALRLSEEQLRQSQKLEAIGTLAGGVAHDFNNLLTVIVSYTDLVLAELEPPSPLRADLEQVRLAAERAAALTKQLLAFSRKQVLQPKVLDLGNIVDGIDKMLRRVIGEDIDLQTVRQTPLSRVKADPGQIEQVILNLAVNARDAMPEGGTLKIETTDVVLGEADPARHGMTPPGRWVLLAVSDTGMGMDEATRARIFEPFFTTKGAGKGTGLGLSTVYGIVKQSGGFVWVESTPGHGAAFKIYLPPVVESDEAPAPSGKPTEALVGSETILLAEDELPVRTLARRCLERAGYRVLEAAGGEEALQISAGYHGPIHLVLTDVVMPQVSGKQLAERLVSLRPGTRVLYMSGYTDDTVVQHGVLHPGTELLQKPFTPESLVSRVRQILDRPPSDGEARPGAA